MKTFRFLLIILFTISIIPVTILNAAANADPTADHTAGATPAETAGATPADDDLQADDAYQADDEHQADDAYQADYARQAEALNKLGLFLGTGSGFELERAATRAETAIMTVRLLGKEGEAKERGYGHPFADVPEWASAHVGYLYYNSIAKGVSGTMFGSDETATPEQYAAFMLRALGYDDSAGDFAWDRSLEKMASLGIITAGQRAGIAINPGVLRGSAAAISYSSLFAKLKGTNTKLIEKLFTVDGAIAADGLKAASAIDDSLALFSGFYGIGRPFPVSDPPTSEELYNNTAEAVFMIETKILSDSDYGSGSGFFISPDGIAVTNMHVIMDMSSANVTTTDGAKFPVEGVLALNTAADLAIIKIRGNGYHYLDVGDPAKLRTAQRIYCIGSPYGFDNTITDGLVSNLSRKFDGYSYIQISAPLAPGSSGGALLNEYGQAVGITTAGNVDGQINLAVPISDLATAHRFPEMRSLKYLQAHSSFGCIPIGDSYTEKGANDIKPCQTMKNDTIMYGAISDKGDADCYTLNVKDPAEMLVSLTSDAAHSAALRFEVSDPSGNIILKSRHYSGEVFSIATGLGASAGKYTVRIFVEPDNDAGGDAGGDADGDADGDAGGDAGTGSDAGAGSDAGTAKDSGRKGGAVNESDSKGAWTDVNYMLYWIYHKTYESSEESAIFFEFEPNDDRDYANYLPDFFTFVGSVASRNDVDYYTFTLTDEYDYNAYVSADEDCEGLYAELLDGDGVSIGEFDYYDGELVFGQTLEPGTYFIKVSVKDAGTGKSAGAGTGKSAGAGTGKSADTGTGKKWNNVLYVIRGWYMSEVDDILEEDI